MSDGCEHHFVRVAWSGCGNCEEACKRRVQRSIHIQRAGRSRIRFRIDEMNDAGTHEILLSHGGTYVTMLEHNPASGSMPPSAENNQTVNMSASGLAWYL